MRVTPILPLLALMTGCTAMRPPQLSDTYLVFFDASNADLSPDAKAAIHRAAAAIKSKNPSHVIVAGEPKTVVAPGFNPKLAEPRFVAVEQALIAEGVSERVLARASLTDGEAKIGMTGNRRVEIRLFAN